MFKLEYEGSKQSKPGIMGERPGEGRQLGDEQVEQAVPQAKKSACVKPYGGAEGSIS